VKQSAALEVTLSIGQEVDTLRSNVEGLNHKLQQLMMEGSVHEEGFVRDAVSLHKEVRESIKDILKLQEEWVQPETQTVNQTINILKVELAQESPDVWRRVKQRIRENNGELEVDI
jgi:dsDNA-specific endonuclease/ATPase MutS2